MENNPYGYNQRMPGQRPQQQTYNTVYPGVYINQPPGAPQAYQARQVQKMTAAPGARMPKERALALARLLKRSLIVASVATFASFSGLVAYYQINTSSNQKSTTSTTTSTQQQNTNPFFNQQGDNHLGTSTPAATATSEPTSTPTTSSGSTGGPGSGFPSGPNSGSHTS